jgi:predicted AlkP superfamily pyrophosphatase or phosphodiesterase
LEIDEHVSKEAERYIAQNGPDLSWVYLQYTDDMGHRYGNSPQFYEAIEKADQQVGRVWASVKEREEKYQEDWMIFITTDHGRDAKTGKGHGGQSERERTTWIATNAKNLNSYFHDQQPGIVDIMPTIARHINIEIPRDQLLEIDGIPLIGEISLIDPQVHYVNGKLNIRWTSLEEKGEAKIWLSTTNHFKSGEKDGYQLLEKVPLKQESITVDLDKIPSSFYKVVIEGPSNIVNKWVFTEEKRSEP